MADLRKQLQEKEWENEKLIKQNQSLKGIINNYRKITMETELKLQSVTNTRSKSNDQRSNMLMNTDEKP